MNEEEKMECSTAETKQATQAAIKKEERRKLSVYVGNLLPGISPAELQKYFSKFGTVTKSFFTRRGRQGAAAIVIFSSSTEAEAVVKSSSHVIEGKEARVDFLKPRDNRPLYVPSTVAAGKIPISFWNSSWSYIDPHRKLMDKLDECPKVLSQIQVLCETVSLSMSDISLRQGIIQDVQNTLKEYYPSGELQVHGSTAIGHCKPRSPFDMYFEPMPGYTAQFHNSKESKETPKLDLDVPEISELKAGTISNDYLRQLPPESHSQLIMKIIDNGDHFKRTLITRMSTYVRFVHKKTGVECHLLCGNRGSLCSTHLLKFYSLYDRRVIPLMKVLHYWAQFRNLTKVRRMSSYSFSLLVVFFLQRTEPPILPSLKQLQNIRGSGAEWKYGFCNDVKKVPASKNRNFSIEKLISQFFEFYANFDPTKMICPFDGKEKPKPISKEPASENEKSSHSADDLIWIENPFPSTKTGASPFIKIYCTKYFLHAVKRTSKCFQDNSTKEGGWGLMRLFELHRDVYEVPARKIGKSTDVISFSLEISRKLQCHLVQDPVNLFCRLSSILVETFEAFLNEAEVVDMLEIVSSQAQPPPPVKNNGKTSSNMDSATVSQTEPSSDILNSTFFSSQNRNFRPIRLLSIQGTIEQDTWSDRRRCNHILKTAGLGNKIDGCSNILEVERAKSEAMAAAGHVKWVSYPACFSCDCFIYRVEMCDRFVFLFTPHRGFSDFTKYTFFMKTFIERALDHLLLENKQVEEEIEFSIKSENNGDCEEMIID